MMIDEQERHVQLSAGLPAASVGYRGTIPGGCNSEPPQQLPHVPIEQQAAFGDVLMHTAAAGFLPQENGGVDQVNGLGNGHKWVDGDSRNILSAMSMNHPFNQHLLTDPSIQETLSPFFQPFGVDASHLPMTNPPIFQSSLTRFDEPVRRRRISISNGQISQLGEDLETVENLYNTQPPPLPHRFDQHPPKPQYYEPPAAHTYVRDDPGSVQKQPNPVAKVPSWNAPVVKDEKFVNNLLQDDGVDHPNGNSNQCVPPAPPAPPAAPANNIMSRTPSSSSSNSVGYYGQSSGYGSKNREPIPGTNAWKRARLLERNRIAASKCRQRKKVAQLQLQKDYDVLIKENKLIKKKLDYYEKLVSKFKKFSEAHLKKCSGSDNQSFGIIEEMLMIDSDIQEVNNDGLVVKIEDA